MSELAIRRATDQDLPLVYAFERQYMEEIEPESLIRWLAAEASIKKQLGDNLDRMFVASEGCNLAGFCYWSLLNGEPHIFSIFVSSEYRRMGLASKLMLETESNCKSQGHTKCLLSTRHNNPARYLFQSVGYKAVGQQDGWLCFEKQL